MADSSHKRGIMKIMQLLYWNDSAYGFRGATLLASDGHVRLAKIPVSDIEALELAIGEITNRFERLPPTQAAWGEALLAAGFEQEPSEVSPCYVPRAVAVEAPEPAAKKKAAAKAKV